MENLMIQNLVQLTHLEKTYGYLPGMGEVTVAALFGPDEVTYREITPQGPDGAHPSLANQKAIARAFVECLTS